MVSTFLFDCTSLFLKVTAFVKSTGSNLIILLNSGPITKGRNSRARGNIEYTPSTEFINAQNDQEDEKGER